jgi:hypothetical protein
MKYLMLLLTFAVSISSTPIFAQDVPLRIELSVERSIRFQNKATLQVLVRNVSTRIVAFDVAIGATAEDYKLSFHHADGRSVTKTAYGRALTDDFLGPSDPAEELGINGSAAIIYLQPGKTYSATINLDELYELNEFGVYEAQVERDFHTEPASGTITSNKLTLTVE